MRVAVIGTGNVGGVRGFMPLDVGDLKRAGTLEGMAWINISLNTEKDWPWLSAWRLERN